LKSSIPKPPRQNVHKEKKSTTFDGLVRIINDHNERADIYQNNEKQQKETNENISYFRVAKSRYGKFETDSRGFVNNSIAIFDSTNQRRTEQQTNKDSHSSELPINSTQSKTLSNITQQQTKGKQAYNLLKKYEKEEEEDSPSPSNNGYFKTTNENDKSSTPVQVCLYKKIIFQNFFFSSLKLLNELLISPYVVFIITFNRSKFLNLRLLLKVIVNN
jgi:hypothetical protein